MIPYFCRKKLKSPVSIVSIASVSPLGNSLPNAWASYLDGRHAFRKFPGADVYTAPLCASASEDVAKVASEPRYKSLDRSVLMAIAASRKAVHMAGWIDGDFGVNIGSSRGATGLFERYHAEFLRGGTTPTPTSPTTTLGNIASWVAQDLRTNGPDISHSITCSTALHAMLNGIAWLQAGMAIRFLVGGSEAPLTPFTLAQMQAMKIYSRLDEAYPCRAGDTAKRVNTMVLGEAASVACLEPGRVAGALAVVEGIGYATEALRSGTSISAEATCFQKSMRMALGDIPSDQVDVVVMHAPGTLAGDTSEVAAIEAVFPNRPMLTTNKWMCGHTFGASGMLSVEMAALMLQHNVFVGTPFMEQHQESDIRRVMVNSVGFGGNAVSVLLGR